MIEKPLHHQDFTIISSAILKDESLSMGARMFYALAQSFSESWNINTKHFAKLLNVSEASVRKFRNELVNAGILSYTQERDEKGKITQNTIYTFKALEVEIMHDQIGEEVDSESIHKYNSQERNSKIWNEKGVFSSEPTRSLLNINDEVGERKNAPLSSKAEFQPCEKKSTCGYSSDLIKENNLNKSTKESARVSETQKAQSTKLFLVVQDSFKSFKEATKQSKKVFKQSLDTKAYTQEELESFKDFIRYRKEKGFLAKSTIDSIVKDFEKLKIQGANIKECVELCINRGWSGLLKAQEAILRYESYSKPRVSQAGFKNLAKNCVGSNKGLDSIILS